MANLEETEKFKEKIEKLKHVYAQMQETGIDDPKGKTNLSLSTFKKFKIDHKNAIAKSILNLEQKEKLTIEEPKKPNAKKQRSLVPEF